MKIAIITGASSGLGKEYVKELGMKEARAKKAELLAKV